MTCYHPLPAFLTPQGVVFTELARHDIIGDIKLPCGQCIGCRMRKAQEWQIRIMHEAQMHQETCFLTLTYGRDMMPPYGSLQHRDLQLFLKRARKQLKKNSDTSPAANTATTQIALTTTCASSGTHSSQHASP